MWAKGFVPSQISPVVQYQTYRWMVRFENTCPRKGGSLHTQHVSCLRWVNNLRRPIRSTICCLRAIDLRFRTILQQSATEQSRPLDEVSSGPVENAVQVKEETSATKDSRQGWFGGNPPLHPAPALASVTLESA